MKSMIRHAGRLRTKMGTLSCKKYSSSSLMNGDSEILELKIINHLYPASAQFSEDSIKINKIRETVTNSKHLSPINIFHKSLDVIRPQSRLERQNLSFLSKAALSQLTSSLVSPTDYDLLLVSVALITRGSSSALQPAIKSGLAASQDTAATLRLLYVAGLVRLRLAASTWRAVQQRLAHRATFLSEADLVALSSASFRCSAAITSSRLQQRLLAAARRLADGDSHIGSLISLLKVLRLARVPCTSLLASLRGLVMRRGEGLSLPAAAHLAVCWCRPPVRDDPLLASLELTLRRRLELLERPPGVSTEPPGGSGPHLAAAPSAAVPDGRPKDIARLLYTFSHLGHTPDCITLELMERWMSGWSLKRPLPLVDALLSLAILGRYPQRLLERALTEQVAQQLTAAGRPRQLSRLALLHLAVSLETSLRPPPLDRLLAPSALPAPCLERELRRRPRLAPLLERLRQQQPAAHAALGYPVPHLNSASVLLSWPDGRRAAVELLDGDALLVSDGDFRGHGDVTEVCTLPRLGDVDFDNSTEHSDVEGRGDVSGEGDLMGNVSDHGDVKSPGPNSAVGLIRLKARLAERLGLTVCWEPRSPEP